MNLSELKYKPEYFFLPTQLARRLYRTLLPPKTGASVEVALPWGVPLEINPAEGIGRAIWLAGVYELAALETLWRLLKPGGTFLDVGANIGYVTSLLLKRVGPQGRGYAFEAHPIITQKLKKNLERFASAGLAANQVRVFSLALYESAGEISLYMPEDFQTNEGLASVIPTSQPGEISVKIPAERLDTLLDRTTEKQIDMMKIDVEGAELFVFKGAGEWITQGKIHNILFEEHDAYPNATSRYLEDHGYTVYRVEKTFWGPKLLPPAQPAAINWEPSNFLATREPQWAERLMASRGWSCLHPRD